MKIGFDYWVVWVFLPILVAVHFPGDGQAADKADPHHRAVAAIRINGVPPQLDGVLEDEIWKNAPLHEGFLQRDHNTGNTSRNGA